MTNDTLTQPTHPVDEELLRYIDGESSGREHDRIKTHVAGCDQCSETVLLFRSMSVELSQALEQMAVAPLPHAKQRFLDTVQQRRFRPAPFRQGNQLRAATIVLALIGAGLATTPVRAWLLDFIGVTEAPTPVEEPITELAPEPPVARPTSSTISFIPAGAVFRIEITGVQQGGSLTIRTTDLPTASARVTGNTGDNSFLVTGDGLRIFNTPESATIYAVSLPQTISSVTIDIAGIRLQTLSRELLASRDSIVVSLR